MNELLTEVEQRTEIFGFTKEILDRGLVPGMDVVGIRFRDNIIFVPEVLISARAMKASLAILEPILSAAIKKENANIVGMSALLTTTMGYMKVVIDKIKAEGIAVKTMVGGAPISPAFAEKIGAEAYAKNATEAVEKAKALVGVKSAVE